MTGWEAFGRYVLWCTALMLLTATVAVVADYPDGPWTSRMKSIFDYGNGILVARYFLFRARIA